MAIDVQRSRVAALLTILSAGLAAQTGVRPEDASKVEWLRQNAIGIRTIEPEDTDFADLAPLKKAIGDARVVQLGENSHGDGATFRAKQRLIRFLHEEMGFDVLAWESGFVGCEELNKALAGDVPVLQAASQSLFAMWTSPLMAPLFEYTRAKFKTGHALRQTGFDIQLINGGGQALNNAIEGLGADVASDDDKRVVREAVAAMSRGDYQPAKEEREKRHAVLGKIIAALRRKKDAFLAKTFENLADLEEMKSLGRQLSGVYLRDLKMGENLVWLANEWYRGKKVIVWAANTHVSRNLSKIDTLGPNGSYQDYTSMGHIAYERLGSAVYTIVFLAAGGTTADARRVPAPVPVPEPGSLEALLHAGGKPQAFLDLRGLPKDHWLHAPMLAHPYGYVSVRSSWPTNFDAVFFIDTMFPNR